MEHAAKKIKTQNPRKIFCFIDLYNIRSEQEFYETFSKEILKATAGSFEEIVKNTKIFFKHILPKISFSPDPSVDVQLSFDWEEVKKNPSEILNLPEMVGKSKKKDLIVCLDEFQNISFFDSPLPFQKKLRAHWQNTETLLIAFTEVSGIC